MKKFLRALSLTLVLLLSLTLFVACGGTSGTDTDTASAPLSSTDTANGPETPATDAGISITVEVVDDKGETKSFPIKTTEKYLRGALEQEKLVEGDDGPYGLYIKKVNGLSADYSVDGAYWGVWEGDKEAATGVDQIELKDGGVYKLVYTKG